MQQVIPTQAAGLRASTVKHNLAGVCLPEANRYVMEKNLLLLTIWGDYVVVIIYVWNHKMLLLER